MLSPAKLATAPTPLFIVLRNLWGFWLTCVQAWLSTGNGRKQDAPETCGNHISIFMGGEGGGARAMVGPAHLFMTSHGVTMATAGEVEYK